MRVAHAGRAAHEHKDEGEKGLQFAAHYLEIVKKNVCLGCFVLSKVLMADGIH